MIVLGIDPGSRNAGWALLEPGCSKPLFVGSVNTLSGDWREAARKLFDVLKEHTFTHCVIESVGWYGARRGMYPLNRLVGALWAYFVLNGYGETVFLVMPNEKVKVPRKLRRFAKNEHEADAIALALTGIRKMSRTYKDKPRRFQDQQQENTDRDRKITKLYRRRPRTNKERGRDGWDGLSVSGTSTR